MRGVSAAGAGVQPAAGHRAGQLLQRPRCSGIAVDKDFATNGYVYLLYVYELNPLISDSDARWSRA